MSSLTELFLERVKERMEEAAKNGDEKRVQECKDLIKHTKSQVTEWIRELNTNPGRLSSSLSYPF